MIGSIFRRSSETARLKPWIGRALLTAWFVGMLFIGAGLLARHWVALPAPAPFDPNLEAGLNGLRSNAGDWLAVHVLYAECRCSHRIADHLVTTSRPNGLEEVVLWVGSGEPPLALRENFRVKRLTRPELARYGVEAAPLLAVLNPQGFARYVGGYTDRKQGPAVMDLNIIAALTREASFESLPVLGCAISERLQRALARLPGFSVN